MSRFDDIGIFWEDLPQGRSRGARVLGPMPAIPDTGWMPPTELPQNIVNSPWISLDCETYDPELIDHGPGWARGKGHICGISIAVPWGKWYFPIRHTAQPELNMDAGRVLAWLKFVLENYTGVIIGAHLLYDIGWFAQEGIGINPKAKLYDCQFAEGLIDEEGRLALEQLGEKYLFRGKKSEVLEDWILAYYMPPKKYWRREIYRSPITLVGPYAEEDAAMPQQILIRQWPELERRGLLDLFEMECKLIRLLVAMRFAGITVDLEYAERCKQNFTTKADNLHSQLEHIAGCSININAADSIAKAFDRHNLPYDRTKTGRPSFTADWLKTLKHPIPGLILSERKLRKLTSTFIDGYIFDAHVNGKVYASFHPMVGEQGGARSGRFSSSDPNLQNIPIRTPEGKEMRAMFTKDKGHRKYRSGDYSQIEYRLLAHFATGHSSADEVRARYRSDPNLDYHDMISHLVHAATGYAVQLKNILLQGTSFDFGPLVREHIKTLNFACVYGVGVPHLAEMLGVNFEVGKQVSGKFHEAVPFARPTMKAVADEVNQNGGVCRTILNRQSHFDLWEPDDWGVKGLPLSYKDAIDEYGPNIRRAYLHAALNYKLQGSAADIMKKAMVDAWENGVFSYTGVPRLTCHDELGFSDPGDVPEDAWEELVNTMERTIPLSVPVRFDFKSGDNWKECKS